MKRFFLPKFATVSVLLSSTMMVGCIPQQQMLVPFNSTQDTEMLAVKDRGFFPPDQDFILGQYKVSHIDRDWTSSSTTGIWAYSDSETDDGYRYRLSKSGFSQQGACAANSQNDKLELGSGWSVGSESSSIKCQCAENAKLNLKTPNGDEDTIKKKDGSKTVVLDTEKETPSLFSFQTENIYQGELQLGNRQYAIYSLHKIKGAGKQQQPVGYHVVNKENTVAMVEVLQPGRAWLSNKLSAEDKNQMTCLMTGLLLHKPNDMDGSMGANQK